MRESIVGMLFLIGSGGNENGCLQEEASLKNTGLQGKTAGLFLKKGNLFLCLLYLSTGSFSKGGVPRRAGTEKRERVFYGEEMAVGNKNRSFFYGIMAFSKLFRNCCCTDSSD